MEPLHPVCVCVCVPLALLAALGPVDQVLQVLVLHRSVLLGARQAEQRANPLSPNVQDGVCVSHFLQVPEQTHGKHIQTSRTCKLFYNILIQSDHFLNKKTSHRFIPCLVTEVCFDIL